MDVVNVHHVEARAVSAPPGIEAIARTDGQPSHRAETDADTEAAATKTKERHIRGRPDRTIVAIPVRLSRPPDPRILIHEPAAVVIRSPAPRFVGDPGPSPIRFPNPAAIAIRGPTTRGNGHPYIAVVRNGRPMSVRVEVFRSNVVAVGTRVTLRVVDGVVAIAGPAVKIVA